MVPQQSTLENKKLAKTRPQFTCQKVLNRCSKTGVQPGFIIGNKYGPNKELMGVAGHHKFSKAVYHFWYCLWFPAKTIVRVCPSSMKQILCWPDSATKYGKPLPKCLAFARVLSCWIFFQILACSELSILEKNLSQPLS